MELKLLGTTELSIGGLNPSLGGPRQRAVLVDLALHAGRTVQIAQLVDDLWGESPPPSATHTAESYVSRLRGVLRIDGAPDLIVTSGSGYLLDVDPSEVDALRFGELATRGRTALELGDLLAAEALLSSALALWRGAALADVRESAFAPAVARRLENERLAVLEMFVDVRLRLGHHAEVESDLETAIARDPFRERFHAQLMTALYRSGRQAEALAAYQRARALLVNELGLEPGRELRRLEQAILRQAAELEPPREPSPKTSPSPSNVELAPSAGDSPGPVASTRPNPSRSRYGGRRALKWTAVSVILTLVTAVGLDRLVGQVPAHAAVPAIGTTELSSANDTILRSLPLPSQPASAASGDGSVWVTSPEGDALYRIDPVTGVIADTIPVGAGAGAIAISGADVWVADALDGTISRISSGTNAVVQTIAVGPEPTGITLGDGTVWVADADAGTLSALDATSGQVKSTISLSTPPFGAAFGNGSVWLTDPNVNEVTRITPRGGPPVQISVGSGPTAVVFGLGSVWVANGLDSTVSRIDPATDSVMATIPVGDGPDALAVVGDSVWVANRISSTLTRIDAAKNSAASTVAIGGSPVALTARGSDIWTATRAALNRLLSGGTLRVVLSTPPSSIDPALTYPHLPFQFSEGVYDALVTFQRVGGSGGLQLVPDLALTIPSPTAGGTVYSFVLRPGLRYSDGQPVRPEDFRRGVERVLELNASAASFLTGIVGAASCQSGKPCDLSRGITVSDRADVVTFHLVAPDASFLDKLTFLFTAPVPPGTPAHDVGDQPVPSTGPYMIGSYKPGREVVFVRNPYFREWSAAAEPAGSPDRIVWTFGASISHEVVEVEHGQADWTADGVPDIAGLVAQFPGQVHVNPALYVDYASFNTRVAPFNDPRVRRAFSLAANRSDLVQALGGASAASPTCQILPPGIPGYRRYCPFTDDPGPNGAWVGPDLAAARKLVAESGTQGMKVTVWSQQGMEATGAFMVSVLRQLGYRASMITPAPAVLARNVNDSRRGVQATDTLWLADYPAAADFFDEFFRCSAFRLADPAATRNGSFFCDLAIDRLMDDADREQGTDPARAAATWAVVDRDVTDAAPWVPLVDLTWIDFLSTRVGNYEYDLAIAGPLLDQMYVRQGQAAHV